MQRKDGHQGWFGKGLGSLVSLHAGVVQHLPETGTLVWPKGVQHLDPGLWFPSPILGDREGGFGKLF